MRPPLQSSCSKQRGSGASPDRQLQGQRQRILELMEQKRTARPILSVIEEKIRFFWARLGAAIERSVVPGRSQTVDTTRLIDAVEAEIEKNLRYDKGRVVAPNRIDLRFDYETYTSLGDLSRQGLSLDLCTSVAEFIHNRRYSTDGPVTVQIEFDPFTRKLTISTTFGGASSLPPSPTQNEAVARSTSVSRVTLRPVTALRRGQLESTFVPGKTTIGVGRSRDNQLVIEHASVSNFHASFTLGTDGTIWLSDVGSSNGTSIDRVPLRENDRRQVRGGERLSFGEVEVDLNLSQDRQSSQ